MTIDEPTMMLVLGLASLTASVLFFSLSRFATQIPGVRYWALGGLAVAFATMLDGPRLVSDWRLASMLFNIPFSIGQAFILAGAMQFCARPGANRVLWLMSVMAAVLTTLFTYVVPDSVWRIGTLSMHQAVINCWTANILWSYPDRGARHAFRVVGAAILIQASAAVAQAFLVVSSSTVITYAAPQLPLANIITWVGTMMNILVGNAMLFLLIVLRLVAELRIAAERDVLTGLLNRRGLRPRIDAILRRAHGRSAMAVMILDIDYFKSVNDRYGHEVGDRVLVVMGGVLLGLKLPNVTPCRWGGEEFCIVVEGPTRASVLSMAEQVRARFAHASAALAELDGGITVSVGIAAMGIDPRFEMSALISAADAQLYLAKESGRDRVAMAEWNN